VGGRLQPLVGALRRAPVEEHDVAPVTARAPLGKLV
jgi:hypothetical protein